MFSFWPVWLDRFFMCLSHKRPKVGNNILVNQLTLINNTFEYSWLNKLFNTFKLKCKEQFLQWWTYDWTKTDWYIIPKCIIIFLKSKPQLQWNKPLKYKSIKTCILFQQSFDEDEEEEFETVESITNQPLPNIPIVQINGSTCSSSNDDSSETVSQKSDKQNLVINIHKITVFIHYLCRWKSYSWRLEKILCLGPNFLISGNGAYSIILCNGPVAYRQSPIFSSVTKTSF